MPFGTGYHIEYHVLEHEATHFLLRGDDPGPNQYPGYDSTAHVPAGSPNILVPEVPCPLKLPEREQVEIAQRIKDGQAVP